jgi:dephospho-CoA kinase
VIDADILARQVVEPGTRALKAIVSTFGTEVLQDDGTLDRKKLGTIIFNDEDKRKLLNEIVHPAVRMAMFWQVLGYWFTGCKYCVLDIPLLIESGLWEWVGLVVVVSWYAKSSAVRTDIPDSSPVRSISSSSG